MPQSLATALLVLAVGMGGVVTHAPVATNNQYPVDNSSLRQSEFREHIATYGLVYRLPQDATDVIDNLIYPSLRGRLNTLGLKNETEVVNVQHITVVQLHSADPATPEKMLHAISTTPPVMNINLKGFYTSEAAKGAGVPWWIDLGVVKTGSDYLAMMAYNTVATAALTPLRDGPLPRCTGPVYAKMSAAARELTRTVGTTGVNVITNGKEIDAYRPHSSLVYSMTQYDDRLQAAMHTITAEMNNQLPGEVAVKLTTLSIVEIGFAGNVLREFYRINLVDGAVQDMTGKKALVLTKPRPTGVLPPG